MRKNVFGLLVAVLFLATASTGAAQPAKVFKIGALVPGERLVRNHRWAEKRSQAARSRRRQSSLCWPCKIGRATQSWRRRPRSKFEQDNVDLIYASSTGSAIAARRATTNYPSDLLCAGTDPVGLGLVDSFAAPGGEGSTFTYRDAGT